MFENKKVTDRLLSPDNASKMENLKIGFLTDVLFSDAGWGAFGYNAAKELEKNMCIK
jgi:hypothetical protein